MASAAPQPRTAAAIALTSWMIISSGLIMLNKHLMVDDGFRFPLALTAGGQAVSYALGMLMVKLGMARLRNPPSLQFTLTQLLPIVVCSAGTLYYGNLAYLHLPVAFLQVLKVATPLFTLAISAGLGLESITLIKSISVFFILLGSSIATFVESGSAGFSWYGFWLMVLSALLEATKVVYIQKLLGRLDYDSVETVVYLGPPTAILLASASWMIESEGLSSTGLACIQRRPLLYMLALLGGFGVNLTTAYAIKTTSSLTFKVWGCLKNTAVVVAGCFLGDRLDLWQVLGYLVSTAGFFLYSLTKVSDKRPQGTVNKKSV